jgi:hypothetical protein
MADVTMTSAERDEDIAAVPAVISSSLAGRMVRGRGVLESCIVAGLFAVWGLGYPRRTSAGCTFRWVEDIAVRSAVISVRAA